VNDEITGVRLLARGVAEEVAQATTQPSTVTAMEWHLEERPQQAMEMSSIPL